ncbi:PilC/PilY family type IV pilus protein [Thiorhodococcus minor]|uniref:PilC beta-propeller domain-containing protein n=1 Tax=Thiorhodococcus minor TaxID=57489 RepID=A0A6M0K5T5_9GAMM|nr:PilC/PilY family type IV pilus protein [Thiorhodococcus minor]NEV65138.1 hypothetical protein [Thiorhodococcus minor]
MDNRASRFLSLCLTGAIAIASGGAHSAVSGYANGQFYSVPPDLQQSIPPNVLLNLSVETPMGGAAYNDYIGSSPGCGGRTESKIGTCFNPANTYIGYFDPTKCYQYQGVADRYFDQEEWEPVSTGMDSRGADSYEPDGEGARIGWPYAAFDGDLDTIWHTEWTDEDTPQPHWIIIDLGSTLSDIAGFRYVPRSGGGNGTIKDYEIYLSDTTTDLIPATRVSEPSASPVASGRWEYDNAGDPQEVPFGTNQSGRYLMLRSTSEVNDAAWTSAAEIQLLKELGPENYFYPSGDVSSGACNGSTWSGNFLNWATMTAIDEFILAMTGGHRTYDTPDKVVVERARKTDNDNWYPWKAIGSSINGVSPSTVTPYSVDELWVYNTAYGFEVATNKDDAKVGSGSGYLDFFGAAVQVCDIDEGVEQNCTKYTDDSDIWYKPEGLMQRNMQRMRFGIMAYSNDNSKARDGGVLRAPMKFVGPKLPSGQDNPDKEYTDQGDYIDNPENYADGNSGVLNYLNKFHKPGYKSYDPVSELFYECLNYYKNRGPTSTFYSGLTEAQKGGFPVYETWDDPIQYWCQTNYIIGINDAYPWLDKKLPGTSFTSCPVATDASGNQSANDCGEPSNPDPDINVTSLTNQVGAMESRGAIGEDYAYDQSGRNNSNYIGGLAYYANTNDIRDDFIGDQTVTTFMIDSQEYHATPNVGNTNVLWLAGKYGGFVDDNGDGVPQDGEWDSDNDGEPDNYVLATSPEKMVSALERAFSVAASGLRSSQSAASVGLNTRAGLGAVYQSAYITSFQDDTDTGNRAEWIGQLKMAPIDENAIIGTEYWDAIEVLQAIDEPTVNRGWTDSSNPVEAGQRYIFSWFDGNLDGVADTGEQVVLDSSAITEDNYPYFDLVSVLDKTDTTQVSAAIAEVAGLVDFIRGDTTDATKRNRVADYDDDGTTEALLLGDIVHSQPVAVGKPAEDFDLLYDDVSYADFKVQYKARRTVVYAGANDGLLHAFNAGFFDGSSYSATGSGGESAHALGTELWAYAPFNLLPHLKWLQSSSYDHVYYMDGPMKAFDAKIFPDDTDHPDGWGTVLVAGMRLGGAPMTVDTADDGFGGAGAANDHEFASAWVLIDITNPEKPPKLLAEIKDPTNDFETGMGFSFSEPAVFTIRENDDSPNDWYLVFGNGPNDLSTVSTDQSAKIYIYKLNDGARDFVTGFAPLTLTPSHTGYVGGVTSVDWNLNYKADTLYFGTTGSSPGEGRFLKIDLGEDASPANWVVTEMIDMMAPVIIKPTVTVDNSGNHWVYFGTGRLETDADTSLSQQEYLVGIRDETATTYPIALADLKDVTDITVYSNGAVDGDTADGSTTLSGLDFTINSSGSYNGWLRKLAFDSGQPSERNLSRHSLLGGALISTTYKPDTDLCTLGLSNLYALYYKTGTAYSDGFLGYGTNDGNGTPALAYRQIAEGIAMAPALHIGEVATGSQTNDEVTAVVQDSNAEIHKQALETESPLDSGEISWRELGTCY